jgi:UDP-glucose 4-epimerase
MRVAVTGATGNLGTSVLAALREQAAIEEIVGYVERILDTFETRHPHTRAVRLRPGFVFKRAAASGIRRLFASPFLPTPLLYPRFIPLVPRLPELLFQAVHSHDVG